MITEDYVSYEVAKLLKEKGFDENTHCQYSTCGSHYGEVGEYNITDRSRSPENYIPAPTHQMAMKWLREVHNIAIVITPSMFWGKYNVSIYKKGNDYPFGFDGDSFISSYEDAVEAAIKYCLKKFLNNYGND